MTSWTVSQIREEFLEFFKKNGHAILSSSSLIPQDPTVLLTMAGMLPFKKIFLGEKPAPRPPRRATCQKCLRMNDLHNVGYTARHHTFFEMLGNFSFGDYFKKEAIELAWALLREVFKIQTDKLWVAVFKDDEESFKIWEKSIGVKLTKIARLGEDNNFWAAGPTGPCGPCSEIYYDFGEKYGCGQPDCGPGCDCERFLEIWNLVFMEFNRDESGKLTPLPKKNIDTGMGLERIAAVLEGVHSNFETDIFKPIIDEVSHCIHSGEIITLNEKQQSILKKIVADHIRAATFLLADGLIPSNEGRGYVLRRLIRRAMLYGARAGIMKKFLAPVSQKIINAESNAYYPELKEREVHIIEVLESEEKSFSVTLQQGMGILLKLIKSQKKVTGADAFKLYDTYGFPFEMTKELVAEKNLRIENEADFEKELNAQKERSRKSAVFEGVYGEKTAGGEGIVAKTEEEKINMAHHHTATHLLQAALRQVLGPQAEQSGSLVLPDRLRFDFKHSRALTEEEISKIEELVNQKIRENIRSEIFETSLEEAKKLGAVALFDEKYGERVRVVKFGSFSQEVCGGTHVAATGQIGCFKIVSDSAIAAGFRRLEALAGVACYNYLRAGGQKLRQVSEWLKVPAEKLLEKIQQLQQELKNREKELAAFKSEQIKGWRDFESFQKGGVTVVRAPFDEMDDLRKISDAAASELVGDWLLLILSPAGRYLGRISESLLKKGITNKIFDSVNKEFDGKGGGRPGLVAGQLNKKLPTLAEIADRLKTGL